MLTPIPIEVSRTTAAMPTAMPSAVNPERIGWDRIDRVTMRRKSVFFIEHSPLLYPWDRASTGSSSAARRAGITPKARPTPSAVNIERRIAQMGQVSGRTG